MGNRTRTRNPMIQPVTEGSARVRVWHPYSRNRIQETSHNTSYTSLWHKQLAQGLATPPNKTPKAPPHLLSSSITPGFPVLNP